MESAASPRRCEMTGPTVAEIVARMESLCETRDNLPKWSDIAALITSHKALEEACQMIVAVKHAMMMLHVHDEHHANEIAQKHGASDVQELAYMAQEKAETAIKDAGVK